VCVSVCVCVCVYVCVCFDTGQVDANVVDVVSFDKQKVCAEAHIHPTLDSNIRIPATARSRSGDPTNLGKYICTYVYTYILTNIHKINLFKCLYIHIYKYIYMYI